ncbi:MAG: chemotaxis protein CheX [Campylobacterota bacterium]|nr:chemotaxis protein CheX [Campylobacterota bacterium]
MNIKVQDDLSNQNCIKDMSYYAYTSVIELSGKRDGFVMISFTNPLLEAITKVFINGEDFKSESEKEELILSVTQEVINIIISNVLNMLEDNGKGISISIPKSFKGVESFINIKNSIINIEIDSEYGNLSVGVSNDRFILSKNNLKINEVSI